MIAAPQGWGTFPCPACGGALPATMPAGLQLACPMCRQTIVVPVGAGPTAAQGQAYQAWAMVHGNTAAAVADRHAPSGAGRTFASTAVPVAVEDGRGGLVIAGAQVTAQGAWSLRAIDPGSGQVRWETLQGIHFQMCPDWRALADRGARLYLAHEGTVHALDAASGAVVWQARVSARVNAHPDRGARCGDTTELAEAGPVVVLRTDDGMIWALDRAHGAVRWHRHTDDPLVSAGELILIEGPRTFDVVRAGDGACLAHFADCGGGALAAGGALIKVDRAGDGEEREAGLVFVDATGAVRWRALFEEADLEPGVADFGGVIVVCVSGTGGAELAMVSPASGPERPGLLGRLLGKQVVTRTLPWRTFHASQMVAAGDAVVLDGNDDGAQRRVALLDARTLAVRHDSGPIADGAALGVRVGPGLLAYCFGESNESQEVRVVDVATGALRWQRTYADVDELRFRAGRLVVAARQGPIEIADPATGTVLARFGG